MLSERSVSCAIKYGVSCATVLAVLRELLVLRKHLIGMGRQYKQKTNRSAKAPPIDILIRAAESVSNGYTVRGTARHFGICRMKLLRFIQRKGARPAQGDSPYKRIKDTHQIFSDAMEVDLANHIIEASIQFYGLTRDKCRKLAYEMAIANNITVPDSWKRDGIAGKSSSVL